MDNKEAIRRIREHMIVHHLEEPRAILITEALEMAIEALKYDVDKVIDELEYESLGYFKIEEMYTKGAVDLRDAVKIIRRGGIDE